jgi:hypothetical protein
MPQPFYVFLLCSLLSLQFAKQRCSLHLATSQLGMHPPGNVDKEIAEFLPGRRDAPGFLPDPNFQNTRAKQSSFSSTWHAIPPAPGS